MTDVRIEQWWVKLSTGQKQWFRENLRADAVDSDVAAAVYEAGGPDLKEDTLTEEDWAFIETQSEFVD